MDVLLEIILLLVGFVLLIKGADYFVDGSSAVAKKLKIPAVVVGLTIVAIGTSLPELAVSSLASTQGSNELALSNVIGSNIFNLLMVLGVTALFINIPVKKSMLKREFPFLLIVSAIALGISADRLLTKKLPKAFNVFSFNNSETAIGTIRNCEGLILVALFVFFIVWTVKFALKNRENEEDEIVDMSNLKCALCIILGAIAIVAGGELVVECAKRLAIAAGMSETLVGLTIVALGTSLPELVTSAVAAKKGEADIAIGNVVGSNISNLLLVLGTSASISSVSIMTMSIVDSIVALFATVVVYVVATTRKTIKKSEGVVLIMIYVAYMAYILFRQYGV